MHAVAPRSQIKHQTPLELGLSAVVSQTKWVFPIKVQSSSEARNPLKNQAISAISGQLLTALKKLLNYLNYVL